MNDLDSTDSDSKSNDEVAKESFDKSNEADNQNEYKVVKALHKSNGSDSRSEDRVAEESHVMSNESDDKSEEEIKIPWHFWLFVGLAGLYLVYRLIQMLIILFQHIF